MANWFRNGITSVAASTIAALRFFTHIRRRSVICSAVVALTFTGCTSQQSNLAKCQQEKQKLLAKIADEEKKVQNLEVENRRIEDLRGQAETELARLKDQGGSRFAEFKRPSVPESSSKVSELNSPLQPPALNVPPTSSSSASSNGWQPKQIRPRSTMTP